jgi:hypothetical protein
LTSKYLLKLMSQTAWNTNGRHRPWSIYLNK